MSQQFCLKWNNHMNNMMDVFKNLLSSESMVDVTLACDGLSLKAHKMVLSACSPFFQSLFIENPCKHPIVILKDMKYTELKAIIEFMYHGEVNVAQEQLSALMKTAETLRVKGLAEMPNEKNSSSTQEEPSHRSVPRTETPPPSKRRRGRVRKRSLSDSNRSDDSNDHKIKQPHSPDIEELSGDVTMDNTSGQFSNLQSQVPMQSLPSHSTPMNSYQKASSVVSQDPQIEEPASADESEFGVEPAKLLEQTLTTDDLQNRRSNRSAMSSAMEMQRRPRSSTDHSSNLVPTSMSSDTSLSANQQPESPPDIKPELLELDPPMSPVAGPSHSTDNSMMMYMDQSSVSSHPGTSFQENTALVPQDSQPQGGYLSEASTSTNKNPLVILTKLNLVKSEENLDDGHVSKEDLSFPKEKEPNNCRFSRRIADANSHSVTNSKFNSEIRHIHVLTTSKKNCTLCKSQGKTNYTKWKCIGCGHYLCKQKKGITCFKKMHSVITQSKLQKSGKSSFGHSNKNAPWGEGHVLIQSTFKDGRCNHCSMETTQKCQKCDQHFCDTHKTGRECFNLYHAHLQKLNDSSKNKTVVENSAVICADTEKARRNQHFLVRSTFKKVCYRCSMRTTRKCQKCDIHFCDPHRTGRKCFNLYHAYVKKSNKSCKNTTVAEKSGKICTNTKINADGMQKDNINSFSNGSNALHVPNDNVQYNSETNHIPFSRRYGKFCFFCKVKRSHWHCKICSKTLCVQESGKTCFYSFHSQFKTVSTTLK